MNVRIFPSALSGRVSAPFSKSDAHRTLIAAALSTESSIIDFSCASLDVNATVNCLCALGARLTGIKEMRVPAGPDRQESGFAAQRLTAAKAGLP